MIPGLGRSPGEENGNIFQYSCLGNPMDRGAWMAIVHLVVQSLSCVLLSAASWTHQASLSFIISWNLLKLMSIESVMPFSHLVLCCPLLLLPSIFPSITVFSSESALRIYPLNIGLPCNPPILLLSIFAKEAKAGTEELFVHPCTNSQKHNNQKVEAIHIISG